MTDPFVSSEVKTILHIDSSSRNQSSVSRQLSSQVVRQLNKLQTYQVLQRDLGAGVPFINQQWINAAYTAKAQRSPSQDKALRISDELVEEIQAASMIVIGLPIYNFNVPAAFKAWIDQIARVGLTFKYSETGPIGLLLDKPVFIVLVSGGTQMDSPADFISAYLKYVLAFIGLKDLRLINATGLDCNYGQILEQAMAQINQLKFAES